MPKSELKKKALVLLAATSALGGVFLRPDATHKGPWGPSRRPAPAPHEQSASPANTGVHPPYLRNARALGATLDDLNDDTPAINAALAGGGTVVLPAGSTALTTHALRIPANTTLLCEPGATIDFEPAQPITWANGNDRAVSFESQTGPPTAILNPIPTGSSTFVSASPPQPIVPGEWLVITESDPSAGDVVYTDWAQVAGATGNTVTVTRPFRVNFPDETNHALTYIPIITLNSDSGINNCTIKSNQHEVGTPGVSVAYSRDIQVTGNIIEMSNGQGLYSYRSNRVEFSNNQVAGSGPASPEFAESTDLTIKGNTFGAGPAPPSQACANLDFGLGYFVFAHNRCNSAFNIALEVLTDVHDGLITDNTLPHSTGYGDGVVAIGARDIVITGNSFESGGQQTEKGIGIILEDCYYCRPAIPSSANLASGNLLDGFAQPLSIGRLDAYRPLGANRYWDGTATEAPTTNDKHLERSLMPEGYPLAASLGTGTMEAPTVTNIGPTSITLAWTTALPLNTQVWYTGPDRDQKHYTDWKLTTDHSAVLSNLAPSTIYIFQTESSNFQSPDLWSRELSATTGPTTTMQGASKALPSK